MSPATIEALEQLGKYALLKRIGRGGMAEVHLARQHGVAGFQKLVVLKTVRPDLADDPRFGRMFRDEIKVAAAAHHPNVISAIDSGIIDGRLFLALEYLCGWPLREVLTGLARRGERLPLVHVMTIAHDAALGLHHVHELRDGEGRPMGVVHRDVTPANIVVTDNGYAKILDFGIAKHAFATDETDPGFRKGTAAYMSPEQRQGAEIGPATDQYALAVVVHELATGLPFPGSLEPTVGVERRPPTLGRPSTSPVDTDLPAPLAAALARALRVQPEERFADCAAFAAAVRAVQDQLGERTGRCELAAWLAARIPPADPERDAPASPAPRPGRRADRSSSTPAFVGRTIELVALRDALQAPGVVTLVGPGGIGKTRLARRALAELSRGEAEAYFCDLSCATDADGAAAAVAAELGLPLTSDSDWAGAVERIGRALATRADALVVLDNVEHIVAEVARVVEHWRASAPGVRLLTTSREPLGLGEELVVEVGPLPADAACELFARRTRLRRRAASASDAAGSDDDVATIVELVDRIPLAIELAAGRAALMSLPALRERLASDLDLLRSRRRDLSPRHASLRATIEWSWRLLRPWERDALAQCSVFRGGFSLDAAEAVIDVTAHRDAPAAVDIVESLRDKSLLQVDRRAAPESSLSLFLSVQIFASEMLENEEATRERHAVHYAALARDAHGAAQSGDPYAAVVGLERTRDNLLAAARWAAGARPQLAATIALGLHHGLAAHGPPALHYEILALGIAAANRAGDDALAVSLHLARSERRLESGDRDGALADADSAERLAASDAERADALFARGRARRELREYREADACYIQAMALCQAPDARRARLVRERALIQHRLGQLVSAEELYREAIALHRQAGNRHRESSTLGQLGLLYSELGRADEARQSLSMAISLSHDGTQLGFQANHLNNLGWLELEQGELDRAEAYLTRARELAERCDALGLLVIVELNLGVLALERGHDAAHRHLDESVALARRSGFRAKEEIGLGNLGIANLLDGELDRAARLFEQALAIRSDREGSWWPHAPIFTAFAGALAAERDDLEQAEGAFASARLAIQAHPRLIDAVRTLGGVLEVARARRARQQGRYDDAREHLRAARDLGTGEALPSSDLRFARRLLRRAMERAEAGDGGLEIDVDAAWLRLPDGERITLSKKPTLRRLLGCLADARTARPGVPVSVEALLAAGWPADRAADASLRNRLRVAVSSLRKLGLGALLCSSDDGGYYLDDAVPLRRVSDPRGASAADRAGARSRRPGS